MTLCILVLGAVACGGRAVDDEPPETTVQALGPDTSCTSSTFNGHTYWFCNNVRNWSTARTKCEAAGLNLVRIDTSAENTFVRTEMNTRLWLEAWIGGHDTAVEGTWRWTFGGSHFWTGGALGSGATGMFSRWGALQPDNFANQDCAEILADGAWIDDGCSSLERYVCESGQDLCAADPQKVEPGVCGCGVPDVDSDGDGKFDCEEQCPNDPTKLVPGNCGCADAPAPAGTPCTDGLCAANTACNGAGVCGNPAQCTAPDSLCWSAVARNKYYWFCNNDRPFTDARQRCQNVGMDLAAVEDAFEDTFITANTFEFTFIGATDQTTEGDFVWIPTAQSFWSGGLLGSPVGGAFTNWNVGQPNDGLSGADCVVKAPPLLLGSWQTRSCASADAFACEAKGFPRPIVECVNQFSSSRFSAVFGYELPGSLPIVVPTGSNNRIDGTSEPVQPPTQFAPGRQRATLVVPFTGASVSWVLGSESATATASSPRCTIDDYPPGSGTPGPTPEGSSDTIAFVEQQLEPDITAPGLTFQALPPRTPPLIAGDLDFRILLTRVTMPAGFNPVLECDGTIRTAINGVPEGDVHVDGCGFPGCEQVLNVDHETPMPIGTPTVTARIELDQDLGPGPFPCGFDDAVINLSVNNGNNQVCGSFETSAGQSQIFPCRQGDVESCVETPTGWKLCFITFPTGRPKVCGKWNAQFMDAAHGAGMTANEDFLHGVDVQKVPASFARAGLTLREGSTTTFEWRGVLDREGCIPPAEAPERGLWEIASGAGAAGLTATFLLTSDFCFDPTGQNCQGDAAGPKGEAKVRQGQETNPANLCVTLTQNEALADPNCSVVRESQGAFNLWVGGIPPSPVSPESPVHFEVTRVSAVVSQILAEEARTGDLGFDLAFSTRRLANPLDGDTGLGTLTVIADQTCTFQDGSSDTCAGREVKLRGDLNCDDGTPEDCIRGDSYWKYVITHEIGHVIQRRAMGDFKRDGFPGGPGEPGAPAKCGCAHIDIVNANTLHCLQSLERPGDVQSEGFGHFFAAKVWNRGDESDCLFRYYKDFLDSSCKPGVFAGEGCVQDPASGLFINRPPIPVNCAEPIKWRNRECIAGAQPGDAFASFGVEYDWMNFLWSVNNTGQRLSYRDVIDTYLATCSQSLTNVRACNGTDALTWQTTPSSKGILQGAELLFGLGSPKANHFRDLGDGFGVSTSVAP